MLAEEPKKTEADMCLEGDKTAEYLACLSLPLKPSGLSSTDEDMEEERDDAEVEAMNAINADDPDSVEKSKLAAASLKKLRSLFKGFKFFLNREVPREDLTLVIRACGGQVSWESTLAVGSSYQEDDQTISHHVIDRPAISNKRITRTYIQPQWVFDCVNARSILPAKDYFPGVSPPPHLSPFVEQKEGDYVPEEMVTFMKQSMGQRLEEEEEDSSDVEDQEDDEEEEETEPVAKAKGKKRKGADQTGGQSVESPGQKRSKISSRPMAVTAGKVKHVDKAQLLEVEAAEERKLGEMMIPKKHRRLYQKIMFSRKKTSQETRKLQEKKDKLNQLKKKQKKLK